MLCLVQCMGQLPAPLLDMTHYNMTSESSGVMILCNSIIIGVGNLYSKMSSGHHQIACTGNQSQTVHQWYTECRPLQ